MPIQFPDANFEAAVRGVIGKPTGDIYGSDVDIPTDSDYFDAVSFVVDKGLFNGTGEGTFELEANMTRAMFVTVLGRMATMLGEDITGYTCEFADVAPGTWYTEALFGPDSASNRGEVAQMFMMFVEKFVA